MSCFKYGTFLYLKINLNTDRLNELNNNASFFLHHFNFLDRKIDGHLKMLTVNFSKVLRDLE